MLDGYDCSCGTKADACVCGPDCPCGPDCGCGPR
jgi:hypothetical protein